MVGGSGSSGTKVALIGLAGVLGAALIAAVASVIVAQMNQKEAPPPRPPVTSGAPSPDPDTRGHFGGVQEISANRNGTVVFKNPQGEPVDSSIPRIPYGESVVVLCQVPDGTGMGSVSALYRIGDSSPPWSGLYAVSDTFTNGDPLDPPGSTSVDPRVPPC